MDQPKWVDAALYYNDHVSKFPGIFPDRCYICKLVFLIGGSNSIVKSDITYNCLECQIEMDWYYYVNFLESFENYEHEYLDDILEQYYDIFEDYMYSLFLNIEDYREEQLMFELRSDDV